MKRILKLQDSLLILAILVVLTLPTKGFTNEYLGSATYTTKKMFGGFSFVTEALVIGFQHSPQYLKATECQWYGVPVVEINSKRGSNSATLSVSLSCEGRSKNINILLDDTTSDFTVDNGGGQVAPDMKASGSFVILAGPLFGDMDLAKDALFEGIRDAADVLKKEQCILIGTPNVRMTSGMISLKNSIVFQIGLACMNSSKNIEAVAEEKTSFHTPWAKFMVNSGKLSVETPKSYDYVGGKLRGISTIDSSH